MPTSNATVDRAGDSLGENGILVDTVIFDIPNSQVDLGHGRTVSLKMAANRYRPAGVIAEDGVTLLLTHSNGLRTSLPQCSSQFMNHL